MVGKTLPPTLCESRSVAAWLQCRLVAREMGSGLLSTLCKLVPIYSLLRSLRCSSSIMEVPCYPSTGQSPTIRTCPCKMWAALRPRKVPFRYHFQKIPHSSHTRFMTTLRKEEAYRNEPSTRPSAGAVNSNLPCNQAQEAPRSGWISASSPITSRLFRHLLRSN